MTTPPDAGVLPGTTQQGIFEYAHTLGLRTTFRDLRVEEVAQADALWLTSSVRLAVAVRAVDGQERPADLEPDAADQRVPDLPHRLTRAATPQPAVNRSLRSVAPASHSSSTSAPRPGTVGTVTRPARATTGGTTTSRA